MLVCSLPCIAADISARTLELIDRAIVMLCLDSVSPKNMTEMTQQALHGRGTDQASTNRWFDKYQVIVAPNGLGGTNMEHSVGDGMQYMRVCQCCAGIRPTYDCQIADYLFGSKDDHEDAACETAVEHLRWQLGPEMAKWVSTDVKMLTIIGNWHGLALSRTGWLPLLMCKCLNLRWRVDCLLYSNTHRFKGFW